MAILISPLSLFLFLSLFTAMATLPSPYLSPSIFSKNYKTMAQTLKIFIYIPNKPFSFNSQAESLFYTSLLESSFVTQNGDEAHLFFIPFPDDLSTRSIARLIRRLRIDLPYWNRTLGADHFFLSEAGAGYSSDRNVVELKKNSIQISSFPLTNAKFIPHKDITLPPVNDYLAIPAKMNKTGRVLVNEFLRDSGPLKSDFCLFDYGGGDFSGVGEALRFGCVPVVVSERAIEDLPFMDVLRWQEIAVFVGGGGVDGVKRVLGGVDGQRLERMRGLGVAAAQHFVWNSPPRPLDAFNMVVYQLWLRRHAIRYVERSK